MIAYQRLRAESGRAGDKNTLQGLLGIVRVVCGPFVWVPRDPARVLTTPLCFAFTFWEIMIRPDWCLVGTDHLRISIWKGSWISDHPTQYHEISTKPSYIFFQNVIYNIIIYTLAVSFSHKFPETRLSAKDKISLFAKRVYEGGVSPNLCNCSTLWLHLKEYVWKGIHLSSINYCLLQTVNFF